jgi:hypothetical protein
MMQEILRKEVAVGRRSAYLSSSNNIILLCKDVNQLPLALIAPLSAQNDTDLWLKSAATLRGRCNALQSTLAVQAADKESRL